MAKRAPVSREWRKEWRRVGGAVLSAAVLAGAAWASATQSFVTLKSGALEHPHLWQWPFIACIVAAAGGLYFILTTYHDRLPMFGRERLIDHSSRYALWLMQPISFTGPDAEHPDQIYWRVGLQFHNGGPRVIEVEIEDRTLMFNDNVVDIPLPEPSKRRILPGQSRNFGLGGVGDLGTDPMPTAHIRYSVVYGEPGNHPRYRRTHAVRIGFMDPFDPTSPEQRFSWDDDEAEQDADL